MADDPMTEDPIAEDSIAGDLAEDDSPAEATVQAEQLLDQLADKSKQLKSELKKAVIGQETVIDDIMLALFCGEHAILTGVPGLAKTLLIRSLASALQLEFSRIQFTPDLMPSDITGTDIIQEDPDSGKRHLEFLAGPVFANLLLADEINRTPPKTQAAMLQTMQEREVSIGKTTYPLPQPFHVFATRNPIEQEGTYHLPEAALDRFMLSIHIDYPEIRDEVSVVRETTGNAIPELEPVIGGEELQSIQRLVRSIPVAEEVIEYAVRLVAGSRPNSELAIDATKEFVRWGAGPRASQYLVLGAKAKAAIEGAPCADFAGIRAVARQVLEHRVLTNFKARSQSVTETEIIQQIIETTKER